MTNRRDFLKTGAATGALVARRAGIEPEPKALAQRLAPARELPPMDPSTKELLDRGAQCRDDGRRVVRRRAHRPLPQQLRLHAREADRQRRGHRHDGRRRPRAAERHVGVRRVARPHEGRRRCRHEGGAGDRQGERASRRGSRASRARDAHARRPLRHAAHDRSVHDLDRAEGRPAHPRQHRSHEGRRREVREQQHVLREGREELREHRRHVHDADGHPQLAAVRGDGGRSRTSPISRRAPT